LGVDSLIFGSRLTKTLNLIVPTFPFVSVKITSPKGLYWLQPLQSHWPEATNVTLFYQANFTLAGLTNTDTLFSNALVGPSNRKLVWTTKIINYICSLLPMSLVGVVTTFAVSSSTWLMVFVQLSLGSTSIPLLQPSVTKWL
jgi:hypothetical protein